MDITPLIQKDWQVINGYGDGQFAVGGVWIPGAVIVVPERVTQWDVQRFADVTVESFRPVAAVEPRVEVLLFGTGARMELVPSAMRRAVRELGIVLEAMDTGAACRTYNVMMAEGRRVAAALLPC